MINKNGMYLEIQIDSYRAITTMSVLTCRSNARHIHIIFCQGRDAALDRMNDIFSENIKIR